MLGRRIIGSICEVGYYIHLVRARWCVMHGPWCMGACTSWPCADSFRLVRQHLPVYLRTDLDAGIMSRWAFPKIDAPPPPPRYPQNTVILIGAPRPGFGNTKVM